MTEESEVFVKALEKFCPGISSKRIQSLSLKVSTGSVLLEWREFYQDHLLLEDGHAETFPVARFFSVPLAKLDGRVVMSENPGWEDLVKLISPGGFGRVLGFEVHLEAGEIPYVKVHAECFELLKDVATALESTTLHEKQ